MLTAVMMVPGLALGQDSDSATDWNARWQGIENTEFESETDKLVAQSNLLLQWGESVGWNRSETWERTVDLLKKWEVSPDIETARDKYLSILDTVGWAIYQNDYFPAWETQLRDFYQNALRITDNPRQESLFLFHLAASLYRSDPYSLDSMRRIEAYLEQAVFVSNDPRITAHIHLLLGKVYLDWSKRANLPEREETSHSSLAVFHFQRVLNVDQVEAAVREQARDALDSLLQKGLQLEIKNRFHPDDDVRITVALRNLSELNIRVDSIPWLSNDLPLPIDQIERYLDSVQFDSLTTVFEQTLSADSQGRVGWEEMEIRIGDGLTAGWYAVEVSGGGLNERALLLVTAIDLVVIPRDNGTMTIWAVDAQTADPVENGRYHVFDEQDALLFSGRINAKGMADIVMGRDQGWAEVHVYIDGNPAMISFSDLSEGSSEEPWLIPDKISVVPGDKLDWVLIPDDDSVTEPIGDMLVYLPDGGVLIPQHVEASHHNRYSVQLPLDIDQFGPVYLFHADGRSTLLAHLLRDQELPLKIDLRGERFTSDSNLFVSSTPVGIRVYPVDMERSTQLAYVRIQVERMSRPFAARPSAMGGKQPESQIAFEHIARFADPTEPEAYWELPEIEQSENLVPLRIRVFPLGSDDLLAESYLGTVPFRAKVSLGASQQIITVGQQVGIQVLDVQRAAFHTRPFQGELVAYRESWENRYIHRKKGTPLAEEEYRALPDRSLLGTAKTDYRLVERGVVREEVLRQQVNLINRTEIPILFDRQGYYRIEFEGRDTDLRADYPSGPLELWVLPESGRLDAFQSAEPRLIVEDTGTGNKEVLVLADRTNASVLVDLQFDNGHSETHIAEPGASGIYLLLEESSGTLETCLAAVARERQTSFLCEHLQLRQPPIWDVRMQRVSGLNPGSEFTWQAIVEEGTSETEPVWVIYPEDESSLAENLVSLQQKEHTRHAVGCETEATTLDYRLPIFQPVGSSRDGLSDEAESIVTFNNSGTIEAIYPELRSRNTTSGGFIDHRRIPENESRSGHQLFGQVPSAAGRWSLMAFYPGSYTDMAVGEWEFSTDLPIRTAINGPSIIRVGDQANAVLQVENTTRQILNLKAELETDGVLVADDLPQSSFELPGGQSIDLAYPMSATRPGSGRLLAKVEGNQSVSSAAISAEVHRETSIPVIRVQLAETGENDWQKQLDLAGINSPRILVSSGLGSHLHYIWTEIRNHYVAHEPMLASLTDWAVAKVGMHHGLTADTAEEETLKFLQALGTLPLSGGIRWTEAANPDPWLSALVLWAMETFSISSEEIFQRQRGQLRSYLETVLIDTSIGQQTRLHVLRALATHAANDAETRPSRIQAKTFLEFFQNRDQLSTGNLAMLMNAASAYRFAEEVRILQGVILDRLGQQTDLDQINLWDASLVYLVLSQETPGIHMRNVPLKVLSANMGLIAENPGWQQAGAFLNLLAAFFWEGDFSVDGSVVVQLADRDPLTVDLKPHAGNRGQWMSEEIDRSKVSLKLDTTQSRQPVIVTVIGERLGHLELPPLTGETISFQRRYVEQTLLSGSHLRTVAANPDNVFHKGETLIQSVELVVDEAGSYAEFQFNVPAGCSLTPDSISYNHEAAELDGVELQEPEIILLPSSSPLYVKARIVPFLPGRHRFTLPFKIQWSGEYALPAHELRFPNTGEVLRIGSQQSIKVAAE